MSRKSKNTREDKKVKLFDYLSEKSNLVWSWKEDGDSAKNLLEPLYSKTEWLELRGKLAKALEQIDDQLDLHRVSENIL